jgi:hypothetical protein
MFWDIFSVERPAVVSKFIGDFLSLRLKIGCDNYFSIPFQITIHYKILFNAYKAIYLT